MSFAVITGASSGIGEQFAKALANKGYSLILVARRKERLEKIKENLNCECKILLHDLANKEECYKLLDEIKDLDVEIFINNAGYGDCNKFQEMDDKKLEGMIDLNVTALTILSKGIVNKFTKSNKGMLLNVASSAGLLPAGPYMSQYYASKAYVKSLSLGISRELKESKSNVYVGALCPGPVNTEFNNVANVEFALKGISPKYCAEYALKQMRKKKVIIVPSFKLKLAFFFARFASTNFLVKVCARQQRKKIGK